MAFRIYKETRLMYNCAHPGSSNEIVTVEFGKRIGEKLFFQKVLDLLIVTLD